MMKMDTNKDSEDFELTTAKKESIKCTICEKEFAHKKNLYAHIRKIHKLEPLPTREKEPQFQCEYCEKKFAFERNINAHMRMIHQVEPVRKPLASQKEQKFQCDYCEKKFAFERNLNAHMRMFHQVEPVRKSLSSEKEPQFQCKYCEKKFAFKKTLMEHLKNHQHIPDHDYSRSRKSRLVCPYETCEEYFLSYTQMRAHLKQYHGITTEFEQLSFGSVEEFKQWKKKYEAEQMSSYLLGQNYSLENGETRQTYYCHRSFNYIKKSNGKRSTKNIGSNKIGKACPSLIDVTTSSNMYQVKLWKTHVGHSCELGRIFLHKETRAEIAGKLSQGIPFQRIIDDIRNNANQYEHIREYLITRKDLENVSRAFNIQNTGTYRHRDDAVSINIWVNEMKDLGDESPVLFYKAQSDKDEVNMLCDDDFVLILMTKFQSDQLKKFGHDKICIDGTHGTNAYKFQLFSLVTVDEYGSGCPVAFCFSNRSDETLFKLFFNKVKSKIGTAINANIFMSDDAPAFYNAWRATMGCVPHQLLCTWHVLRNWSSQLCKISGGQEKKKPVYNALKALLQMTSVDKFTKSLTKILNDLYSDSDTHEFGKYFEKTYSRRPTLWAYCYRIRLGINTNMYLESLHKILKYEYLGGKKVKRLDKSIDAVMKIARDEYFKRFIKINKKYPSQKLCRVRKSHADSQSIETDSIKILSPGLKWLVRSQKNPATKYVVFKCKNEHTSCIISCKECNNICLHDFTCSCIDNMLRYNICKHIHACVRLSRNSGEEIKSGIQGYGMDNELNELMPAARNYNQKSSGSEAVIKKTEVLLGLLQKTSFNSNDSVVACKMLDKLIDMANKNSNVISFKTTETVNTKAKVTPQIRLYSTKKSKLQTKKKDLISQTFAEKTDIGDSLLLNKTGKRINTQTSCNQTCEKSFLPGSKIKKLSNMNIESVKSSWFHVDNYTLSHDDANIILDNDGWLTDEIINAACTLMKTEHNVAGLQNPLLAKTITPSFKTCNGNFIQICHVQNGHWNCISGSIQNDEIIVHIYDSLFTNINEDIVSIVSSIYRDKNIENMTVYMHNIEKQVNSSNCGLHAIANAKFLCLNIDPSQRKLMPFHREHLFKIFNNNSETLDEFPSVIRTNTISPKKNQFKTVHCYSKCRKPAYGKMFTCNKCSEQFHEWCVIDGNDHEFFCNFCNPEPPVHIEIS